MRPTETNITRPSSTLLKPRILLSVVSYDDDNNNNNAKSHLQQISEE